MQGPRSNWVWAAGGLGIGLGSNVLHYARERRRRGLPLRQQGEHLLCTLLQAAFEGPQPPREPVRILELQSASREPSMLVETGLIVFKKVGIVVGRSQRRQVAVVEQEQEEEEGEEDRA